MIVLRRVDGMYQWKPFFHDEWLQVKSTDVIEKPAAFVQMIDETFNHMDRLFMELKTVERNTTN